MLSPRQNYLETARFGKPDSIPVSVLINDAMWAVYREELEAVVLRYPELFHHTAGAVDYHSMHFSAQENDDRHVTDVWGCEWVYPLRYMDGAVISHPLKSLDDLESYTPPVSPYSRQLTDREWQDVIAAAEEDKRCGRLVSGGTDHGIMLLRHTYLRGFENAMLDYMDEDERLYALFDMIVGYYLPLVNHHIRRGADVLYFAEDLGTQAAPIIGPDTFRKWIAPAYNRLMQPCRDAGVITWLHSDGHILELTDILLESGVDIINLQDLCNGIDQIAQTVKGRACIDLDIDRQKVIPFGTPGDIDDLIHEEVVKLGSPNGGLMFTCGLYPPTPPENVDALCRALRKYRTYWWE